MLGYFETTDRLECMQITFALAESSAPSRKQFASNNFWLLTVSNSAKKRIVQKGEERYLVGCMVNLEHAVAPFLARQRH